MEEAEIPRGGNSSGGGHSCDTAGASTGDTDVGVGDRSDIKDLEPLWPSHPSLAAAAMLTWIWVENPATNERWTACLGIVE
jgi:hypothetical protein